MTHWVAHPNKDACISRKSNSLVVIGAEKEITQINLSKEDKNNLITANKTVKIL